MKEIKFRIWAETDDAETEMVYLGKSECSNGLWFDAPKRVQKYTVLMQFTGLKDKNGKEIYEGDMLSTSEDRFPYEVFFGKYGWCIRLHMYENRKEEFTLINDLLSHYEIIGNIYENPELLNKK